MVIVKYCKALIVFLYRKESSNGFYWEKDNLLTKAIGEDKLLALVILVFFNEFVVVHLVWVK